MKIPPWVSMVGGAALAALGFISNPQFLALIPPGWAAVITGIGTVLAAFGVHAAHANTQAMLEQLGATKPTTNPPATPTIQVKPK